MDNLTPGHSGRMIRYLDGEMNHEEELEFENLLVNDKEMREELQDLLIVVDSVRLFGLRQKVTGIHPLMMEEVKPGKPPLKRFDQVAKVFRYSITVVAGIVLVLLLVEAYRFYNLSTEGLFQEKYNEYKVPASPIDTLVDLKIENSYRRTKYQQIIYYHNKTHFVTIHDLFYLGISFLKTENLSKAIDSFNSILEKNKFSKTDTLQDETEYYLALTYLKNKDYDQAIVLMKKIHADPDHVFNAKFTAGYIQRVKMLKWR